MEKKRRIRKIAPQHMRAVVVDPGKEPTIKFEFWSYKGGKASEEEAKIKLNLWTLEALAKTIKSAMNSIREADAAEWNRVNNSMKTIFGESK